MAGVRGREVGSAESPLGRRRSRAAASPGPVHGAHSPLPAATAHLTGTVVAVPAHVPRCLFCVLIASVARLGFVSWAQVSSKPICLCGGASKSGLVSSSRCNSVSQSQRQEG